MKIIILTQYYPPEHGAPQNRLHDLARRWVAGGEDVTVLTAMPNYPNRQVFKDYAGKLFHREQIDGVNILRSWIFTTKKDSIFFMLLSYFSFVLSSIIAGVLKLSRSDYVICESPP